MYEFVKNFYDEYKTEDLSFLTFMEKLSINEYEDIEEFLE